MWIEYSRTPVPVIFCVYSVFGNNNCLVFVRNFGVLRYSTHISISRRRYLAQCGTVVTSYALVFAIFVFFTDIQDPINDRGFLVVANLLWYISVWIVNTWNALAIENSHANTSFRVGSLVNRVGTAKSQVIPSNTLTIKTRWMFFFPSFLVDLNWKKKTIWRRLARGLRLKCMLV